MTSFLPYVRKFLLTVILMSLPLGAQSGLGIVTGTVQDPSKGTVPAAGITLTEKATGIVRKAVTNGSGIYYFGSIPVGPYHLMVEAAGFKEWSSDFQLEAGQTITVDAAVSVGDVQSKVDVSTAAPQISTEGSQLSDVKTARTIHDLPLNGRQISNLFALTPGVEGGQNTQGAGAPRTNGMMVGSTEMLIDGMSYVDRFSGGIARVQPGLDTIQEYRIETAGSGAEFDRPSTIELVTRSGTNQFHGGLFETLRDNYGGLVARAVQDGNSPAKLIRNEFGGFVGGPVVKNKAFFFYDQELLRQRSDYFAMTGVPTEGNWGGDFSNVVDTSGNRSIIYNPYTTTASGSRSPFPGNVIPTGMIKSQLLNTLRSVTQSPSGPTASANPWISPNFQMYYPQNTNQNSITGRFDEVFSEKDNVSVRYTQTKSTYLQTGGQYAYPPLGVAGDPGTSATTSAAYNITAHYTHIFNPSVLNDLQLGANRSPNAQGTAADNVNWDSKLGLPNPFGATGWPTIGISQGSLLYYGYWDSANAKAQNLTQFEIDDNVTWVKGKHSFKFGFKGRQEYNNVKELQQAQGSETFDGNWTGLYDPGSQATVPYTGVGLASLELGLPGYLSNQYNRGFFYFRQKEVGFFAEDSWKVTPKLTLSLGLRWEFWTPYREQQNRLVNIDLNSLSPTSMQVVLPGNTTLDQVPGLPSGVIDAWAARGLTAVSANSIKFPSALYPHVWNDLAPHIGVAYRITDKWVMRGGYGASYFPMPLSQILQTSRVNAPLNLRYQNNVDSLQGSNGVYSMTSIPTASDTVGGGGTATVSPAGVDSSAQGFLAADVNHWNDNKIQEWTVTLEHQLASNLVMKLSYTGNHGSNLQQNWDVNAPVSRYNYQAANGVLAPTLSYLTQLDPNWRLTGANGILRHNGYSNSNSLQASIEKRFSNDLSFQFFYVYTHAMTTNDSGAASSGGGGFNASATGGGSQGGGTSSSVPANSEILGNPNLTDSQRLRLLYTNSSQVPAQRITWSGVYQLPLGKGKKFLHSSGRWTDAALGGWQIGFVGTWDGGFWMGNSSNEYQFKNPSLGSGQRLNLTAFGANQKLWFAGDFDPTQATNVNLTALEQVVPVEQGLRNIHPLPVNGVFGNQVQQTLANGAVVATSITDNVSWNARNYMLGPRMFNMDASLQKYFTITERIRLRMSGDFFNVFNHPNLNNPDAITGLINLSSQPNSPRIIQVGARLEF